MKPTTVHLALWPQSEQVRQEASKDCRVRSLRQMLWSKGQDRFAICDSWDPRADIVVYCCNDHFEADEARWSNLPAESQIVVISEFPGDKASVREGVWLRHTLEEAADLILDPAFAEIGECQWLKEKKEQAAVLA